LSLVVATSIQIHTGSTERINAKLRKKSRSIRSAVAVMAGIPGKSGPPGNQNVFRHGLAWISQRRVNGVLNSTEQSIREEILAGSLAEKGARSFGI
jgi:hypothetical protein